MKIITFIAMLLFSLSGIYAQDLSQNKEYETQETTEEEDPDYEIVSSYRDFRVAIGGGYAYRAGKRLKEADPVIDKLSKDLMHGFVVDFDAQYFFKETWGLGINANFVRSSATADRVNIPGIGNYNNYKETNQFIFIGPSLVTLYEFNKFLLTASIAFGPLFFKSDANISGFKTTKTIFGGNLGVALEYGLGSGLGAGLKLSYTGGTTKSLNVGGQSMPLPNGESYSLSNYMITGFLSFKTW